MVKLEVGGEKFCWSCTSQTVRYVNFILCGYIGKEVYVCIILVRPFLPLTLL